MKNERKNDKEIAGKEKKNQINPEQKMAMKAERAAKRQASKKAYIVVMHDSYNTDI